MKTYFSLKSILNNGLQSSQDIKKDAPISAREKLLADISKTQNALEIAYAGFDNVTEPDLIDCYIYEVNSVLKRYKFLMEQAAKLSPLPEVTTHSAPLSTETPVTSLVG